LCVYGILDFKYETQQTRLGLRFNLSTHYAYRAYFCHKWHQVDTQLLFETRLVLQVLR